MLNRRFNHNPLCAARIVGHTATGLEVVELRTGVFRGKAVLAFVEPRATAGHEGPNSIGLVVAQKLILVGNAGTVGGACSDCNEQQGKSWGTRVNLLAFD